MRRTREGSAAGKEIIAADERGCTLINCSRGRMIGSTRGPVIATSAFIRS
jgi:hypothetical protein